jgi:putative acetyltransferase
VIVKIEVIQDDLSSSEVCELIAQHLSGMHEHSPSCHVNALGIERLKHPSVTFWVARIEGVLCGCGALKALDSTSGEIKSMRTVEAFLRQGVGQAILNVAIEEANGRNYSSIFLETGTGPGFEAAHQLYLRNGFAWCGAFGDYVATEFNVFMVKHLR